MDAGLTVVVLGTGIMGAPMARNLLAAGRPVAAWNRTRGKTEHLASDGGRGVDTPAEACGAAGVVVTMLADGDAVGAVMLGDGGLDAMADDAVWLQMSTVGGPWTDRLAAAAADRGVGFVDAPVLGTKEPAESGDLLVLASGPELCASAAGRSSTRWTARPCGRVKRTVTAAPEGRGQQLSAGARRRLGRDPGAGQGHRRGAGAVPGGHRGRPGRAALCPDQGGGDDAGLLPAQLPAPPCAEGHPAGD